MRQIGIWLFLNLLTLSQATQTPTLHFQSQNLGASFPLGNLELFGTLSKEELSRISLIPSSMGRFGKETTLSQGIVTQLSEDEIQIERGLIQERISVNANGIRQDFFIPERPSGWGQLVLNLVVQGSSIHSDPNGNIIAQLASGRNLLYHSLHVFDASGKELQAKMVASSTHHISIFVNDLNADYPLLIDPTFSDANWKKMSNGGIGTDENLAQFDRDPDGTIYVGGRFSSIAGISTTNIAQLKNGAWMNMGNGIPGIAQRLISNKNGLVFVNYGFSGKNRIAQWDGTSWTELVGSDPNIMPGLFTLNSSKEIFAGADEKKPDGSYNSLIVKWKNNDWEKIAEWPGNYNLDIRIDSKGEMYVYPFGELLGIFKWNGNTWDTLGTELVATLGRFCGITQVAFDSKNQVFACAESLIVDGVSVGGVTKWDGSHWKTIPGWTGHCQSLHIDANDNIIASGANTIELYDGKSWSQIGKNCNGTVSELFSTSQNEPIAMGEFISINDDPLNGIGKYVNGHWVPLTPGTDGSIITMAIDSNDNLVVGGNFHYLNGIAANGVARWDGSQWHSYGSGPGIGGISYIALDAKGYPVVTGSRGSLARWNGTSWSVIPADKSFISSSGSTTFLLDQKTKDIIVSSPNILVDEETQYIKTYRWKSDGTYEHFENLPESYPAFLAQDSSGCIYAAKSTAISYTDLPSQKQRVYVNCDGFWEDLTDSVYQSIGYSQNFLKFDKKGRLFASGISGQIVYREKGEWKRFSTPFDSSVRSIAFDRNNNIYVAGKFLHNNGKSFHHVALWNGSEWLALGSGLDTIASFASAVNSKGDFFVSGSFKKAGNIFTPGLAMFNGLSTPSNLHPVEPRSPGNSRLQFFDLLGRKQVEFPQ